jgi:Tol biopolymer transport system component
MKTMLTIALGVLGAVLAAGGAAATAPRPAGVIVLSCSGCPGDTAGAQLYTFDLGGHRLRPIPDTARAYWPRWSPDARSVVYSVGFSNVWRTSADGSRPRLLTSSANYDTTPTWSADGRKVIFERIDGATQRGALWGVPASGGRSHLVYRWRSNLLDPDWLPNGTWIAFADVHGRMFRVRPQGSGVTRLGGRNLLGRMPRWSPDGTKISFLEVGRDSRLSILNMRTGRVRRFGVFGHAQDWSSDGRWLAVGRLRGYECDSAPPKYGCEVFELLLVDVSSGRSRVVYHAPYGELYGLDWAQRR